MKKYDVIGLMSGTSLDGLDIAFVRFSYEDKISWQLLDCSPLAYEKEMAEKLKHAAELSGLELKMLDKNYGKWIGEKTRTFMDSRNIKPDLIVSHGHTIFHQPEKGITLQIGDGYEIMKRTGVPVICDLRSLDVSLGGQGAPLVPIGDKFLFSEYDFCLNLGGFSNISFDKGGSRIAFDICPVNTVLNLLASKLDLDYDMGGEHARLGEINFELLEKLNSLGFYVKSPPKSLGVEWVHEHIFPLLNSDKIENLLHTFCRHIAEQITSVLTSQFGISQIVNKPKMLITGGGAKNTFLIELIKTISGDNVEIVVPESDLIDFKEAIIFAYLGLLRYQRKINTLSSVTGAKSDSSGGVIYDQIIKR